MRLVRGGGEEGAHVPGLDAGLFAGVSHFGVIAREGGTSRGTPAPMTQGRGTAHDCRRLCWAPSRCTCSPHPLQARTEPRPTTGCARGNACTYPAPPSTQYLKECYACVVINLLKKKIGRKFSNAECTQIHLQGSVKGKPWLCGRGLKWSGVLWPWSPGQTGGPRRPSPRW